MTLIAMRLQRAIFGGIERLGAALLLSALAASPARAQDPPPLPVPDSMLTMICKKVCDVVSGLVHDSLANAPLGGAFVVATPSGATVTADSLGRFVIASDGLVERLTVYHSVLDELGLGALTAQRPDLLQQWQRVRIATPSLPTIWPRLCASRAPSTQRGVIIAGTIRFTDNTTRIAGAKVIAQWLSLSQTSGESEYASIETLSDSTGGFVLCGVEDFVEPSLVALSTEAQSGVVTLPADSRPLRRVDLVMARNDAGRTILRGRVVNEWNAPLPNVRVSVDGLDGEAVTGMDGIFRMLDVPLGSRMLAVRALNYPPGLQAVDVLEGDVEPITVSITRLYALGTIKLSPRDTARQERVEFERRRRTGVGIFIDSITLEGSTDVRAALKSAAGVTTIVREAPIRATVEQFVPPSMGRAPGVAIAMPVPRNGPPPLQIGEQRNTPPPPRYSALAKGHEGCPLNIFLDGQLYTDNSPLGMDRRLFVAIEVYASGDQVPPGAYSPAGLRQNYGSARFRCGAVLFWTRLGLRP